MSQEKALRLAQAQHNEELCMRVDDMQKFPDWVITTAFYAAIHYLKYKMFPLTLGKNVETGKFEFCDSFEEYYTDNYTGSKESRHTALHSLVKTQCKPIAEEYKMLLDLCWGARYTNYMVSPEEALRAKELLAAIKGYCSPPVKVAETADEEANEKEV